ncbi:hypothetical protein BaRGS_00005232 [Batillaria attramentaria]|uniref:Uncharacterized protein n=1 Tax=Batillaria attramentaria TaxID=370345 RepID=A0ABD0LWD0_9CAEN
MEPLFVLPPHLGFYTVTVACKITQKLEKRGHVPAVPVREAQSPPDLSQGLGQQLSPLRIANMTHSELQEILPKLVLAVQQQGSSRRRPDWWSHSVPWTQHSSGSTYKVGLRVPEAGLHVMAVTFVTSGVPASSLANLRRAVQLCCSHLSQHTVRPSPAAQPRVIDWLNSNPPSRSCAQNTKGIQFPIGRYICVTCVGKSFLARTHCRNIRCVVAGDLFLCQSPPHRLLQRLLVLGPLPSPLMTPPPPGV